jgi:hypothetical protein
MIEPSKPFGGFTTTPELPRDEPDAGGALNPPWSIFRGQSTTLFLFIVLLALVTFFFVLRPDAFPTAANAINMATNASVLLVLVVGARTSF